MDGWKQKQNSTEKKKAKNQKITLHSIHCFKIFHFGSNWIFHEERFPTWYVPTQRIHTSCFPDHIKSWDCSQKTTSRVKNRISPRRVKLAPENTWLFSSVGGYSDFIFRRALHQGLNQFGPTATGRWNEWTAESETQLWGSGWESHVWRMNPREICDGDVACPRLGLTAHELVAAALHTRDGPRSWIPVVSDSSRATWNHGRGFFCTPARAPVPLERMFPH